MRHLSLQEQVNHLNQMLQGHYAYYGVAGNLRALLRVHRAVKRYWRNLESSELAWHGPVEAISADQGTVPAASAKAALLLPIAVGYRHTVNQPLKSPVREICTLGSVGA
jgi:hypothetical protein